MQIKEVKTADEILSTFDVLVQIYENLDKQNFLANIQSIMAHGYKMAAVYEEGGSCIGVVGTRIVHKLHHGKVLEIEDFMIDRKKRGIGVGKMLIRWVEWQSLNQNCNNITGNLETKRLESQRIFSREGFILDGFFFRKKDK